MRFEIVSPKKIILSKVYNISFIPSLNSRE